MLADMNQRTLAVELALAITLRPPLDAAGVVPVQKGADKQPLCLQAVWPAPVDGIQADAI